MSAPAILAVFFIIFIIVWMSLTFTNKFCTGKIGFGLCYNTSCPACAAAPSPKT